MSTMSCAEFGNVASELALGVLYGEERAAALTHVETCRACRQELTLLTDAADEVRLIVPGVEPPAGFEQRVVARIAAAATEPDVTPPTPLASRRPRRLVRPLIAAAAALLAFVAASAFVLGGGSGEETASITAPMRTNAGEVVGDATLSADPTAIRVEVPDWAGLVNTYGATVDATYWLAVEDGEGQRNLRRLPPADEHPWTVELDAAPSSVAAVSIVDNGGTVWCTARFT